MDERSEWTPPPVHPAPGYRNEWDAPVVDHTQAARPRRRGLVIGTALAGAGVVAGAIVGTTVLSGAATPSTAPSAGSGYSDGGPGRDGHGPGLSLSGSVTAVGSASVTIKTSTATNTYTVNGNSDIDKNGEAQLSSLKVGDAVRFSVDTGNVIDKLHAGDEALDHPVGPPAGGGSSGG